MAELIDFESEPGASTTLRDQRRPGRPAFANPNLIPLMRGQAETIPGSAADSAAEVADTGEACVETDRRAALSTMRGVCLGVALGSLMWASIGAAFWYYFSG